MNRVRLLKEENNDSVVLMPRRHERPPAYGVAIGSSSQVENEYDAGETSRPAVEELSDNDSIMSASGITPIMDGRRTKRNGETDTSVP